MRLVRSLTLAAFALGSAGVAVGVGCGSTANNGSDGGSGGSGGSGGGGSGGSSGKDSGGGMSITPPPAPTGPKTTSKTPQNFAIHQLFLGDTDPNGTADPNAWQNFGYNIDGLITTAASTNVCSLVNGGGSLGTAVQTDGNGGIDNSFGPNIFENVIGMVDSSASTTVNGDLVAGDFTLMFNVTGLDSTSTQTSTALSAAAFAGGKFPGTPTFTTADNWPVLGGSLLTSTSPIVSALQFSDSYVVGGKWVSGAPTDISLSLAIGGFTIDLPIQNAVITFDHSMPHHAANGNISGIIPTKTLVDAITKLAGRIEPGLCSSTAIAGILAEITDSSDILTTGPTFNKPGVTCDGISIGLGFIADEIGQPMDVAAEGCPKPNPCDDAGVDASACDSGSTPPPTDAGKADGT
jgi:hypothetical protein